MLMHLQVLYPSDRRMHILNKTSGGRWCLFLYKLVTPLNFISFDHTEHALFKNEFFEDIVKYFKVPVAFFIPNHTFQSMSIEPKISK